MRKSLVLALVLANAAPALAANYVVYLHGRREAAWVGGFKSVSGYTNFDYGANWNGTTQRIDQVSYAPITSRCSGGNSCILVGYSTGGLMAQYAQKAYGVVPIKTVVTANAGGGSELANNCSAFTAMLTACWTTGVDFNLRPSWARGFGYGASPTAVFAHAGNTNAYNKWWYLTASMLAGDDDGAVAFHSSLGCAGSGAQTKSCSRWGNWSAARSYYYEGAMFSAGTDHFAMPSKALGSI